MTNQRFACAVIGAVSFLLVPRVAPAGSQSPTEWVQTTVAEMQNVLPEQGQGGTLTPAQLKEVSRLVNDSFHFPKLAQMVLGRHWKDRTTAERKEFITLFQQLLEKSHVMRMATEGKAEQRFVSEEVEKDRAIVQAVAKVDDSDIPIEYILVQQNGTWKIYDLGVDGMRLSQIYRSQFNKVISRSSYDDLIQRMKMKLEEIELEQKASVSSYSQVSTSR
jgi:phospholipid transport system substrate-binding protein